MANADENVIIILLKERSNEYFVNNIMNKKVTSIILLITILVSIFILGSCQNNFNNKGPTILKPNVDYSNLPIEQQVQKRTEDRYGIRLVYLWEEKYDYYTKYTFIESNAEGGKEFNVWAYNNASEELVLQDNYQSVLLLESYEKFLGDKFKSLYDIKDIKVFVEFDNEYIPGKTRYAGYSYWPINYPVDVTIEKAIDDKIDLNAEIYIVCLSEESVKSISEKETKLKEDGIKLMEHLGIRGSFQFVFAPQKIYDKATRENAFKYYHEYLYNEKAKTIGFRFDIKQISDVLVEITTVPTTTVKPTDTTNDTANQENNNTSENNNTTDNLSQEVIMTGELE